MEMKINYDYIRYRMKEEGMTTRSLAKLLNCSEQSLYNMFSVNNVPSFYCRLFKICKELNISLEEITKEVE